MKMSVKDVIADALIMGMSMALLWHFFNIWRYGQLLIQEPNVAIRIAETAGLLVILVFGIKKYVNDLVKKSL